VSLLGTALEVVLPDALKFKTQIAEGAVGFAKRFLGRAPVRPGAGSRVTSGALKLGKEVLIGPKPPGMSKAAMIAAGVGGAGVGVATVASHRQVARPIPQSAPAPRTSTPRSTSTKGKKCCPAGTKRMACFRKDVDEVAETKRKAKRRTQKARAIKRGRKEARRVSAKQKASRERFARAARKGPIKKGTRL